MSLGLTIPHTSGTRRCMAFPSPHYFWAFHCHLCQRSTIFTSAPFSGPTYDTAPGPAFSCHHCSHQCTTVNFLLPPDPEEEEEEEEEEAEAEQPEPTEFCESCSLYVFVAFIGCWACGRDDKNKLVNFEDEAWGGLCVACGFEMDSSCVVHWRVSRKALVVEGDDGDVVWRWVKGRNRKKWLEVDEPVVDAELRERFT